MRTDDKHKFCDKFKKIAKDKCSKLEAYNMDKWFVDRRHYFNTSSELKNI
jgi:hypothetical protein